VKFISIQLRYENLILENFLEIYLGQNELKYLIDKYLDKKLIKEQNIFNERYIDELKYLFFQKKSNNRKIWIILMFQMWYIENMQI
jgi:hypothetical protein